MKIAMLLLAMTLSMAIPTQTAIAQSGFVPFTTGYIAERQDAYRVTTTSSKDLSAIPEYEVYRVVFSKILGDPVLLQQVDSSDREGMLQLPDHTDVQFLSLLQKELRSACTEILESRDQKEARDLVSMFVAAEESYETALIDHYVRYLGTLSDSTTSLVQDQLVKLTESDSLIHTATDYVGFSEEFPEFMKSKLLIGCDRVLTDVNVPRPRLLTDDFIHRDNLRLDAK